MLPKMKLYHRARETFLHAEAVTLKSIPLYRKLWNERRLKRLAEQLANDLKNTDDKEEMKTIITAFLLKLDQQKLLFDQPFLQLFLEKGYLEVAEEFIAQAEEDDKQLQTEKVFQAMRNVWIMNSLQLHWDILLSLSPAIYGYSMLYPYTDNYLDDPDISKADKETFNAHISRLIAGETSQQDRISELMAMIERQYPRKSFPAVFESIAFIHDAQIASLHQHALLSKDEILQLSFTKGGSSVLTDAFLIKGFLSDEEMLFAFEYGTFLQLLDDLQDVLEDEKDSHFTLFSRKKGVLDEEIRQLVNFIYATNLAEEGSLMKDVIRSCTLLMVMEAVSRHPDRVSKKYYRQLNAASHVRLSFYQEMRGFFEGLVINFSDKK